MLRKKYDILKKQYDELVIKYAELQLQVKKGQMSSITGKMYETQIYDILKYTFINDIHFNVQPELGGSSNNIDIICNYESSRIGIEVKKYNTPDWMQCSIKYDGTAWIVGARSKLTDSNKKIFERLLNNVSIFGNKIPPFMTEQITYEDWKKIKETSQQWNDIYISIPNDTIQQLYINKGCQYIQISNYGLYHLQKDTCKFNVPEFAIEQRIRIRIKVHSTKTSSGLCNLSITAACQPTDINKLTPSVYSLDDIKKLPQNLIYRN